MHSLGFRQPFLIIPNVSVEQLEYEPVCLARVRRLAQVLVAGLHPPGKTTIERIEGLDR